VAFANTNGGTIYVGVGARSGPPTGVEAVEETIGELKSEIEAKVTPFLDVDIDSLESQGRNVVRIEVPEGQDKPYCLDGSRLYLRHESETAVAVRDEMVQLIHKVLLERGELAEAAPAEKEKPGPRPSRRAKVDKGKPEVPVAEKAEQAEVPESPDGTVPPPTIGVQIVNVQERGDKRYYTIKDLRNGNTVHNVTLKSARRLWRYAISQHEQRPPDADAVEWKGNVGLLRSEKRAGKRRYDFVQRMPDGALEVYYGVTEQGCEEPWRQFLIGDDANGE
jgi:hypothetical protein